MEDISIRLATLDDIAEIVAMERDLEAEEDAAYGFVAATHEQVTEQLGRYALVAEVNVTLAGFIAGSLRTSQGLAVTPQGQPYLEVDDLYVRPALRGRGIGGALLEALVAEANAHGITRIHLLSSTKDHDRIVRFYRAHGFTPWGTQFFR